MYYVVSQNDNYLVHHGIKGQHWGVQNGPPYPLGSSQKSASEKKSAGKTISKGSGSTGKKSVNKRQTKYGRRDANTKALDKIDKTVKKKNF